MASFNAPKKKFHKILIKNLMYFRVFQIIIFFIIFIDILKKSLTAKLEIYMQLYVFF